MTTGGGNHRLQEALRLGAQWQVLPETVGVMCLQDTQGTLHLVDNPQGLDWHSSCYVESEHGVTEKVLESDQVLAGELCQYCANGRLEKPPSKWKRMATTQDILLLLLGAVDLKNKLHDLETNIPVLTASTEAGRTDAIRAKINSITHHTARTSPIRGTTPDLHTHAEKTLEDARTRLQTYLKNKHKAPWTGRGTLTLWVGDYSALTRYWSTNADTIEGNVVYRRRNETYVILPPGTLPETSTRALYHKDITLKREPDEVTLELALGITEPLGLEAPPLEQALEAAAQLQDLDEHTKPR